MKRAYHIIQLPGRDTSTGEPIPLMDTDAIIRKVLAHRVDPRTLPMRNKPVWVGRYRKMVLDDFLKIKK